MHPGLYFPKRLVRIENPYGYFAAVNDVVQGANITFTGLRRFSPQTRPKFKREYLVISSPKSYI
jgi:hypothetical protein